MTVMQKFKSMQEFTVEYLNSTLLAKLLLHNCSRAKNTKDFTGSVEWKISAQEAHIQQ